MSPFKPISNSQQNHSTPYSDAQDLRMIETPLDRTIIRPYLDQPDDGLREITKLIGWGGNDANSEKSESED